MQALIREIRHYGDRYPEATCDTLHIGGGVPSLLHVDDLKRLSEALLSNFQGSPQEATIEVDPLHVSADYLDTLGALGFTRVSLAVQSFYPDDRAALGLPEVPIDLDTVVEHCHAAPLDSFSIDLAFGWNGQEHEYWAANLSRAARLDVPHVTLVEVTAPDLRADDEAIAACYEWALDLLPERGYDHYEIANFARPGARSQQNEAYWSHTNYLGLGSSAHSFWWDGLPAYRWANVTPTSRYAALIQQGHAPTTGREARSLDDLADEYVVLRLRTGDGLDLQHLNATYGLDLLDAAGSAVEELAEAGYLTHNTNTNHLLLTRAGKPVCDAVTQQLLQALATY